MNLRFLWRVRGSKDGRGAGEVESCFSLEGLEPGPWNDRVVQNTGHYLRAEHPGASIY